MAHQRVLVLVLALATVLTLCLGEEAVQEQSRQQGQRRPWAARDKSVSIGTQSARACWQQARPDAPPLYQTDRVGRREQRRLVA